MQFATDIVCFSGDACLVETRRMVFERAGFSTAVALNCRDFAAILRRGPVGIVVLCHSLSIGECEWADRHLHRNYPQTRVLILNTSFCGCGFLEGDEDYDSMNGPEGMLSIVGNIFRNLGYRGCLRREIHA